MTIQYSNGRTLEAVQLSRTETILRAAIEGADDVMQFSNIHGVWVSEDCEPVQIVFAWQRAGFKKAVSEDDCICSKELAGRLIHLLYSGETPLAPRIDPAPQLRPVQLVP